MNKHRDELVVQFELLLEVQKGVKESLNAVESTWQRTGELPCFCQIDRWEQESIQRIQQVAQQARSTANEIMAKNIFDIRQRLDRIGSNLEERRKEENYLDDDIMLIKNRLEQINHTVHHIHESIRVDQSMSDDADWNAMLKVTVAKNFGKDRNHAFRFVAERPNDQGNLWVNLKRRVRTRHWTKDYKTKQTSVDRSTSFVGEPVILTAFAPRSDQSSESNSLSASEASTLHQLGGNSFLAKRSSKSIHRKSFDHDQPFPATSDA